MTEKVLTSTDSVFTGEHPVYKPQEETRTYANPEELPNDTPPAPTHPDVVVLNQAPTTPYIQTTIDVAAQALRRTIAAVNEELRQRA